VWPNWPHPLLRSRSRKLTRSWTGPWHIVEFKTTIVVVVYTYVIHSYIVLHVSLLYDCLFPHLFSSFSFWCIQTAYTAYEHCNCLEFHWNMTYSHMLPGYSTFHQVYIRYILHIMGIPTYHWINIIWMVLRGILSYTAFHYCMIVP